MGRLLVPFGLPVLRSVLRTATLARPPARRVGGRRRSSRGRPEPAEPDVDPAPPGRPQTVVQFLSEVVGDGDKTRRLALLLCLPIATVATVTVLAMVMVTVLVPHPERWVHVLASAVATFVAVKVRAWWLGRAEQVPDDDTTDQRS